MIYEREYTGVVVKDAEPWGLEGLGGLGGLEPPSFNASPKLISLSHRHFFLEFRNAIVNNTLVTYT